MFKTKEEQLMELNEEIQQVYKQQIGRLVDRIAQLEKDYVKIKDCAIESQKECEELRESLRGYEEEIAKLEETEPETKHKFKKGDRIKFVGVVHKDKEGDIISDNGIKFTSPMQEWGDGVPREILNIDYDGAINNDKEFGAIFKGIEGLHTYHEDDFEKVEE